MRKRKGMAWTLSLILVMALTGCGGSGVEESETTEAVRQNPLLENDDFDNTSPAEPVSDDEFYSEMELDEMAVTASVIEYVAQGTYWIGSGDDTAMIFYFEDDHAFFDLLYEEDGEIKDQPISGLWSLDYDYLTILDDETDISYELEWNLSQEGDNYCFELTEDGETYYLYESAAEDVSSTLEILTSYLMTEEEVDETEIDISTFLEGYVGHSVIDAFMLSGLSPDFETRSYCASILGYSSYSGTSEENLTMIELMGGTVR